MELTLIYRIRIGNKCDRNLQILYRPTVNSLKAFKIQNGEIITKSAPNTVDLNKIYSLSPNYLPWT